MNKRETNKERASRKEKQTACQSETGSINNSLEGCSSSAISSSLLQNRGVLLKDARILLAEDDISNQKIIEFSLRKNVKSIEIAPNGLEALEKYKQSQYDLILMDLQMPIMGGIETCIKIRALEKGSGLRIPIIALTGNYNVKEKEQVIEAGIDAILSKPFNKQTLLQLIEKYL